jgi:hypothetical protein
LAAFHFSGLGAPVFLLKNKPIAAGLVFQG